MFFSGEVTLFSYRADGLHGRIRRKREGGREGREGGREGEGGSKGGERDNDTQIIRDKLSISPCV